ncbi:unnamed protein product, partial [marine sediment metagenome]
MSRSYLISAGEEHPEPICEGWRELVKKGCVSYEWAVCNCLPCERSYQVRIA